MKTTLLLPLVLLTAIKVGVFAEDVQEIQKRFSQSSEVRLKLVLGQCEIGPSSDGKIHVKLVYAYSQGGFEPILKERSRYLLLQEKFHGTNPEGHSRWTLAVPDGVEIAFRSATGDLTVASLAADLTGSTGTGDLNLDKVKGNLHLRTGTGRVQVLDSEGDCELSSGTGRVTVRGFKGNIEASSGTGDVHASEVTLESDGEFSSGTGDAEVVFPGVGDFDLSVSSGTGSAVVKMNGQPIQGRFEFTCQAKRGRIVCPEQFDQEEAYTDHKTKYLLKSLTRGDDASKIRVSTGTGQAKLVK
jgi:DUF4097 and DUF4098 domain-containing protein YvlB